MTCGQRSGLPSFAGAASRMDFLLKAEKIVVECKMARKGLGPKEVGEQLITDIARDKAQTSHETKLILTVIGSCASFTILNTS